jgi:multiple sugar transport system permease protein
MSRIKSEEMKSGLLFALPWIIGFTLFLAWPLLSSLYYSLTDFSVLRKPIWIGLDNYKELFQDEVFWKTLTNTFIFAALSIPVGTAFAILLALLLNTGVKGMALYRTIFFIPSIVQPVSLAMLWLFLFRGDGGVLNEALKFIGISTPPDWLNSPDWSKPALVLMGLWGVGNAVVIYLAGLQNVPQALYEAADLDGATPLSKTWHVTLPMISPVIQFNVVMGIIGSFQVFTIPYIMFPGGRPERATYFYSMYLFDNAFLYQRMGYAAAMGWVMFIIIFALTMLFLRLSESKVHYST